MIDYFICCIFFIIYTIYIYIFGTSLKKDSKIENERLLYGYIYHGFLIAFVGIPIQFFKLSYLIFELYMVFLTIFSIIFIILRIRKYKIKIFPNGFLNLVKNNWFLFVILFILIIVFCNAFYYIWNGNCNDDTYYLNRIATLGSYKNPFNINSAMGYENKNNLFDIRMFNVWELENSFYVKYLHVSASLFSRLFLSIFNYFLLENAIVSVAKKINLNSKNKIKESSIQYINVILIALTIFHTVLFKVLYIEDDWKFVSAMWYGSSFVRCVGLLLMTLIILDKPKYKFITLFRLGVISVLLMSKATQAAPLILIFLISYFISLLLNQKKYRKLIVIPIISVLFILGIILNNNAKLDNYIFKMFTINIKQILPIFLILLTVIWGFLSKDENKKTIGIISLIMIIFMIVDPFDNIMEKITKYDFVGGRTVSSYILYILFMSTIYLNEIMNRVIKKPIFVIIIFLIFGILFLYKSLESYEKINHNNFIYGLKLMKKNYEFIPNVTKNAGKKLNEISIKENTTLNILTPSAVTDENKLSVSFATDLRAYSKDSIVLHSLIDRFGYDESGKFKGFDSNDVKIYESYLINFSDNDKKEFKKLLDNYPVNLVIVPSYIYEDSLKNMKFKYEGKTCDLENNACLYFYYRNLESY